MIIKGICIFRISIKIIEIRNNSYSYTYLCLIKMHNEIINEIIDTKHPTISINPVLVAMISFL